LLKIFYKNIIVIKKTKSENKGQRLRFQ